MLLCALLRADIRCGLVFRPEQPGVSVRWWGLLKPVFKPERLSANVPCGLVFRPEQPGVPVLRRWLLLLVLLQLLLRLLPSPL